MPQLSINGQSYFSDSPPDTPLLWVIREDLRLTGTDRTPHLHREPRVPHLTQAGPRFVQPDQPARELQEDLRGD